MKKTVDIIVINWNSGMLTVEAISPYLNTISNKVACNVMVVDNNSNDGSRMLFEKNNLQNVIYNQQNLGFGRACNQVLTKSKGEYILLLNPDTTSEITVLEKLVDFLENNSKYAVAGPQQLSDIGEVLRTCTRFPNFLIECYEILGLSKIFPKIFHPRIMTDWNHLKSRDVDHVMGSYMLIRKSVLDKVGYMDTNYFVYLEDLDLSKRIHNEGYKSFFSTEVQITHQCGKSGDTATKERHLYSINSRRYYWKKYLNNPSYNSLVFLSVFIEPFTRIVDAVIKKKSSNIRPILSAYRVYILNIIKKTK